MAVTTATTNIGS